MAAMSRLLPMMAISTFTIFLLALLATPTVALSNTEPRVHARGHDSIAKRKRNALKRAKRCRPKTSSLVPASTSPAPQSNAPATTSRAPSNTPAPTTTKAPTSTPVPTTSKAVTTSVSTNNGGGGGTQKLVLAWPNGSADLKHWGGKNLKGVYSWSPFDPNAATIGTEFYPMFWGTKQKSDFSSKVDASKYEYCMGFNEPNQHDQSNMSVDEAITLWRQYMEPASKKGCQLVSPATTSAPSGLEWMKDFFKKCPDCKDSCSAVALHWYDVSLEAFKAYVTNFHTQLGKDIWITEFACQNFNGGAQCSDDQTWALHKGMAKFAKENDWIKVVAPFGAMREMQGVNGNNQMMDPATGKPNALGQFWLNESW